MLGMPAGAIEVDAIPLVVKQIHIMGSLIGSPAEMRDMLSFAAEHQLKPW